ncbi:MAG: hypothetical protein K0Q59_379 [Paenibacillus sp.]|nr:hypothetical protein [Paenibacillus sp.]
MSESCEGCGAILPKGETCESIYGNFLALEFTDPGYGRVHFLTVACYMIQHKGYSDEAYVWIQSALRNYLEKGHTTESIRRDAAQGPGRTKGIRRLKEAAPLPKINWTMTIADVAKRTKDAESYCRLIEQWGRTTLDEMGPLVLGK